MIAIARLTCLIGLLLGPGYWIYGMFAGGKSVAEVPLGENEDIVIDSGRGPLVATLVGYERRSGAAQPPVEIAIVARAGTRVLWQETSRFVPTAGASRKKGRNVSFERTVKVFTAPPGTSVNVAVLKKAPATGETRLFNVVLKIRRNSAIPRSAFILSGVCLAIASLTGWFVLRARRA